MLNGEVGRTRSWVGIFSALNMSTSVSTPLIHSSQHQAKPHDPYSNGKNLFNKSIIWSTIVSSTLGTTTLPSTYSQVYALFLDIFKTIIDPGESFKEVLKA